MFCRHSVLQVKNNRHDQDPDRRTENKSQWWFSISMKFELLIFSCFPSKLYSTILHCIECFLLKWLQASELSSSTPEWEKMKVLSVLLVAALTTAATAMFWRKYIKVDQYMNWNDAQAYCRKNYVDLAIIEAKWELYNFRQDVPFFRPSWIGNSENSSMENEWVNASLLDFTVSWLKEPTASNTCVSVELYYIFAVKSFSDCAERQNFICYTWKPDLIMVQEMKTWEEALKYCRLNYTDLVSFTTKRDYLAVNRKVTGIWTHSFWTSLRFLDGSWYWVNPIFSYEENLSFLPSCPAPSLRCGSRKAESNVLENRNCEEKMNFICYKKSG